MRLTARDASPPPERFRAPVRPTTVEAPRPALSSWRKWVVLSVAGSLLAATAWWWR
ncbi:hypothetical protein [Corallococcus silvisoli]|uniref:hypothetical protein n=1 Tax=Corallococcus silvisoli TaxID=2697031 RepID=UPI00137873D4|nr:hypothetical protein [Corallococcus silvisoli]NBD10978.1 hypothetical protein [Corallococcus silvisoli]